MTWYQTVYYRSGMGPQDFAEIIRTTLDGTQMVHVKGVQVNKDMRRFYDEISEIIGDCCNVAEDYRTGKQTGQKWMEIRYDHEIPDVAAYRHSKNAQPLHTDESYISDPADVMAMYCVTQAPEGGETVFVSAQDVVATLKRVDLELYQVICETPIRFAKGDESKTRPVITFDEKGPSLNWNYYCVHELESQSTRSLARRFFNFLKETVAESEKVVAIDLAPGEAVLWWDERLLHGRNAFKAYKTDDRFIWKTGIKLNHAIG